MSAWSFYRLDDGRFTGRRTSCAPEQLQAQTPDGCAALEGRFDHLSQRVDLATGTVVDYVPPAPADTELETWAWDAATRRHVATPTLQAHKRMRLHPVLAAIEALEAEQSLRPMREALVELFAGRQVPADTKAKLAEISAAIAPLRAKVQAILAAATQAELDAIP